MIIYDEVLNKNLNNITILLKQDELIQLVGYLESLILKQDTHFHLNNDSFSKEITLALYGTEELLSHFSEKYSKLILSNE